MPKPTHQTNSKAIKHQERALRAMEMRKAGLPYSRIAKELGYSDESGPYRAVKGILDKQRQELAVDVRELELARLEDMLQAIWAAVQQGDMAAIDRVLRIQERRAKFLGLDGPVKLEHGHSPEHLRSEFIAAIRAGDDGLLEAIEEALSQAPEEVIARIRSSCDRLEASEAPRQLPASGD